MSCLGILHANQGDDIARCRRVDFDTLVGMHLDQPANTFAFTCKGVQNGIALFEPARVNSSKGQSAKAVVHDFEGQSAQWLVCINNRECPSFHAIQINLWLRGHFCWVWQIINNAIQHHLDTLILERRTTESREELQRDGTLADAALELVDSGLLGFFKIGHHDVFVLLNGCLDQLFAVFSSEFQHVLWNVGDDIFRGIAGIVPDVGFHGDKINCTDEVFFLADWQYHD